MANFQQFVDAGRTPVHLQFAFTFVTGTENRTNLVTTAYTKYLGRTASTPEVGGWVAALQQGLTGEQLTVAFVSSPEDFIKQGSNNSNWLNRAYQDILGRAPDPGSAGFLTQLNSGVALSVVATALVSSNEYRTRLIADVVTGKLDVREAAANLPDEPEEPELPDEADMVVEDEEQADTESEAEAMEAEA